MHRSTLPIVAVLVLMMAFVGSAHAYRPNAPANWCNKVSCFPYAADIVKSQSDATIQVTVTLRDSGSHVSDWGDPRGATCKAGVCDVYVQVYCSTGEKCYVMFYLHDESHTYGGIPPDTYLVNLYVNEKLFLSIDPPVPTLVAVGGSIYSVNTLALFSPWLTLIGLTVCIGTAVVVVKRRQS